MTRAHRGFNVKLPVAGAVLGWVLAGFGLVGCGGGASGVRSSETSAPVWVWSLPAGFALPAVPADNPMRAAKVDLGRHLFYEKRLSGNGTQACSSCHFQEKAFTDGLPVSKGSTGESTPRNAQSLGNVVYSPTLTWANPSLVKLERQMEVPLFSENVVEMGVNDSNKAAVLQRLADFPLYPPKFVAAFPGEADPINWSNITKAIATFERTLISGNSRYDQFLAGKTVLTEAENRGKALFFGDKTRCSACHGSFNFNDQLVQASSVVVDKPFHNIGLYNVDGLGAYPEPNRGVLELSGLPRDMGAFRTPSLRNVEVTAPYMHDGSVATLEEVLDILAAGGRNMTVGVHAGDGRLNPFKSPLITRLDLDAQDKADLLAFLKTLTDQEFLRNPQFANPF